MYEIAIGISIGVTIVFVVDAVASLVKHGFPIEHRPTLETTKTILKWFAIAFLFALTSLFMILILDFNIVTDAVNI